MPSRCRAPIANGLRCLKHAHYAYKNDRPTRCYIHRPDLFDWNQLPTYDPGKPAHSLVPHMFATTSNIDQMMRMTLTCGNALRGKRSMMSMYDLA